jgi:hypothetical protein
MTTPTAMLTPQITSKAAGEVEAEIGDYNVGCNRGLRWRCDCGGLLGRARQLWPPARVHHGCCGTPARVAGPSQRVWVL